MPGNETNDFDGFTAPAAVPGQEFSRMKKGEVDRFLDDVSDPPRWRDHYFQLLNEQKGRPQGERWDWRKCLWVAWHALPKKHRFPVNKRALADFLGVTPSTMRMWALNDPLMSERVRDLRVDLVDEYVGDVLEAAADCAVNDGPQGHQDRKMILEMAGVYRPKVRSELSGPDDGPVEVRRVQELSDDELLRIAAGGSGGAGAAAPGA